MPVECGWKSLLAPECSQAGVEYLQCLRVEQLKGGALCYSVLLWCRFHDVQHSMPASEHTRIVMMYDMIRLVPAATGTSNFVVEVPQLRKTAVKSYDQFRLFHHTWSKMYSTLRIAFPTTPLFNRAAALQVQQPLLLPSER